MDKTPKERIVFDEGVYYGDEGSEISIEDITSREGITVEEVLDSYTEEEIFENAMNMMDIDRSEELAGLKAFLDGSDRCPHTTIHSAVTASLREAPSVAGMARAMA